ncbi:MAG: type II toxin-antitoxin system VapB family antitoxin [Spirochaetaceae bacterium]|nr:type II toxin-antitoxin system VapB family antitoxin [Spirochaetaceae bacterium]
MKTSIDIPESMLNEAMEITGARTTREAIVTAVADFNRRARMAALVRHLGTCDDLISPAELAKLRETP